ncbi:hypothetical protein SZN_13477 [Streptomyces zinciresistens K42]|uniref:Transport-associated OB type 2 domain-containing protein n=1 Tax=Streptomyces zinciresistens K42 TaxID=700597 RepID=G2GB22_9ACTN|nr:TOBE domain-containing protein [Streptomyces zinciresistens]EGX59314.1 hypothetical protein SZN_13477 [Streptomyces zinciresistens K42]
MIRLRGVRVFRSPGGAVGLPLHTAAAPGTGVLLGPRPRDPAPGAGPGHGLAGTVSVTGVLGRSVEATVRLGGPHVSPAVPRGEAAGLRGDDPVRLSVRPENLLLFEADRPERPGRRIAQ